MPNLKAGRTAWPRRLLPLCLLLFFALALDTALHKSLTVDEPVHLLRGLILWQTDDLRRQTQPPLSHWLIGSLLFTEPQMPAVRELLDWPSDRRSSLAEAILWQSGLNVERLTLLARLPIIFTALLLGALLISWARLLFNQAAQWLVGLLFALSPNVLALASLATTDLVTMATFVATIFAFWYFWRCPSPWRWLLVTLCLGLAIGSKLTALLLLPMTLPLSYVFWQRQRPWWQPGLLWLSMLPGAALLVWALYHFEVGPAAGLPFPVPAPTYVRDFFTAGGHVERGHAAYLLGQQSVEGWWHYFVVAFLVKTPVPTLLLLASGLVLLVVQRDWRKLSYLAFPAGLFFVAASYTRVNIGYRHLLLVLPLAWLVGAAVATRLQLRFVQVALVLLLAWYAVGSLRQHPHHLAYFNDLVGGSANGYKYLGDSNLDWGQDLPLLAEYVSEAAEPLWVYYFGASKPAYYGVTVATPASGEAGPSLASANPPPGRYAVSVSFLQGMVLDEPDQFDWFRRQEPVGHLGYSILLYEVPARAPGEWIAHCYDPAPLVDEATAGRLLGVENQRHVYFDCRTGWVFPQGGRQPGWYILPAGDEPVGAKSAFREELQLVYRHETIAPNFAVYYWPGSDNLLTTLTAGAGQGTLPDGTPVDLPVLFDETLSLAGYQAEGATWTTIWQVAQPAAALLSVAGHLYHDAPAPAVVDGLSFPGNQWQPGDVFLQYHAFDVASYDFLETGLYDFVNGERLPFTFDERVETRLRLYPPEASSEG
ncbi:MAG: glycosyltransferase family 39 protein [Chloroflexi bacterium]|nr:glycosyltransferase family 39 protein [Chloroflexota bacterium]MCI0579722.1 glycosyltransferase family 39 protein [Chloroflexota bacterium]MCI0643747.1 glycosyltransferase family 39 protein [Chloroflexota bacterium]MCI0728452.1 glycosyltransferase family 39 protein [Chloroflexota bacterium]